MELRLRIDFISIFERCFKTMLNNILHILLVVLVLVIDPELA
jgi:hypothetical protein